MSFAPFLACFLVGSLVGYYAGAYAIWAHLSNWSELFAFFP